MNSWVRRLLFATAAAMALWQAPASGAAGSTRDELLSWSLRQVGPAQRSLDVSFAYGGCQRNPAATATEFKDAIRITVTVESGAEPGTACPEIAFIAVDFPVALRAPLAGRPVLDSGIFDPRTGHVPGLVGLAPGDAARIVRAEGLREHVQTVRADVARPVVRAQYPATGVRFPADKVVQLKVAVPTGGS